MKNKIRPEMIAGAVILLALIFFGLYKLTFSSGEKVSADNAPDYAKQMMKKDANGASGSGYGAAYGQNPNQASGSMPHPPSSYGR
ncbi:MAG: hypothetical protein JWL77_6184 [Chthonomonadaceae bacterium]|nr:hypothetical protein [Chthonomonadaceae bacterium]